MSVQSNTMFQVNRASATGPLLASVSIDSSALHCKALLQGFGSIGLGATPNSSLLANAFATTASSTFPQPQLSATAIAPGLTPAYLASLPRAQQKNILGEQLYKLISATNPSQAGKITGMLLELDTSEVLHLIDTPAALTDRVSEASEDLKLAKLANIATPPKLPKPLFAQVQPGGLNSLSTTTWSSPAPAPAVISTSSGLGQSAALGFRMHTHRGATLDKWWVGGGGGGDLGHGCRCRSRMLPGSLVCWMQAFRFSGVQQRLLQRQLQVWYLTKGGGRRGG